MDDEGTGDRGRSSTDAPGHDPPGFDLEDWATGVADERHGELETEYFAFSREADSFASAIEAAGLDTLSSTEWLNGTAGADVIYYGILYRWVGGIYGWAYDGPRICVWEFVAGSPCRGTFRYVAKWFNPTAYPLGIRGDAPGGAMGGDRIYPAAELSGAATTPPFGVDCNPGAGAYACGTNHRIVAPAATATFEICGDDCTVGTGADDLIVGWRGGDRVYGGAGSDRILGEDNGLPDVGGSDRLFGDDGNDYVLGYTCSASTTEHLYGGYGNDWVVGHCASMPNAGHVACPRYISGGPGDDHINGGLGDDVISAGPGNDQGTTGEFVPSPPAPAEWLWIHGWQGNDTLYGDSGHDYLRGDDGNDRLTSSNYSTPGYSEIIEGGPGTDELVGDSYGTLTCDGGWDGGYPEPSDYCSPTPVCDVRIGCEQ